MQAADCAGLPLCDVLPDRHCSDCSRPGRRQRRQGNSPAWETSFRKRWCCRADRDNAGSGGSSALGCCRSNSARDSGGCTSDQRWTHTRLYRACARQQAAHVQCRAAPPSQPRERLLLAARQLPRADARVRARCLRRICSLFVTADTAVHVSTMPFADTQGATWSMNNSLPRATGNDTDTLAPAFSHGACNLEVGALPYRRGVRAHAHAICRLLHIGPAD